MREQLILMEESLRSVSDETNFHNKEVQIIQAEKQTLETVLSKKAQEVKKVLANDVSRVEEELRRMLAQQVAQNNRLQQQISMVKEEKVSLKQNLIDLKRRIQEMEVRVGVDPEDIEYILDALREQKMQQ